MHEQNFEKQVRDKLNELSFTPSPPVWEKVQQQIGGRKERRRLVFWLLPLLFVGGGLAFWMLRTGETFMADGKPSGAPIPVEQKSSNRNGTTAPGETITATTTIKNKNTAPDTKAKQVPAITIKPAAAFGQTHKSSVKKQYTQKSSTQAAGRTTQNDSSLVQYNSIVVDAAPVQQPEQKGYGAVSEDKPKRQADALELLHIFLPATLQNQLLVDSGVLQKINRQQVVVLQKANRPMRWQVGLQLEGGTSGLTGKFLGIGSSLNKSLENFDARPVNNSGGGGVAFSRAPAAPQAAAFWSAGVAVKRNLDNHTALLSGIRYSYYSTQLQVGQAVQRDTLVVNQRNNAALLQAGSYFRNDAQRNQYTNHYHYLEIPLAVEQQLTRRLPLYVQGGLQFGYLVASNALQYDTAAKIYYKDPSRLNRAQVQLSAGLQYRLLKQSKLQIAVGPSFRYSFSRLEKEAFFNRRHWYIVGLGTSVFF